MNECPSHVLRLKTSSVRGQSWMEGDIIQLTGLMRSQGSGPGPPSCSVQVQYGSHTWTGREQREIIGNGGVCGCKGRGSAALQSMGSRRLPYDCPFVHQRRRLALRFQHLIVCRVACTWFCSSGKQILKEGEHLSRTFANPAASAMLTFSTTPPSAAMPLLSSPKSPKNRGDGIVETVVLRRHRIMLSHRQEWPRIMLSHK